MLGLGFEAIKIDLTHVLIGNLSSMLRCNPYKLIDSPRCTWVDFFFFVSAYLGVYLVYLGCILVYLEKNVLYEITVMFYHA